MQKPNTIDEYMKRLPVDVQPVLNQLRGIIQKTAPRAVETISYGMPAFTCNGMLVWFAAHKNHIGFYPKASGIEAFQSKLLKYKCSKGAVQFPLDQPLPISLIIQMIRFRMKENLQKTKTKK